MERPMELRHFIHRHRLIFNEEVNKNHEKLLCDGCENQISGSNYSCKKCSWFILHKSCAQLPRQLEHPLHPNPLRLIHAYSWKRQIKCDGCNTEVLWGLIYHCSDCNFSLESNCASLPLTVQAEIHEHPLTLLRRSLSFTCDACGKQGKSMFYLCAICPFFVHLQCSSDPLLVKHVRRSDALNLTNPLQDTDPMESTSMLKCKDPGFDESIDSLTYVVKKSKLGDDKVEIAVEIKHFSHEHDLKLIDEQLEKEEKCDGCLWPVDPPFYTCTQWRFFLHKYCVELPRKKSHPLHRHPLTLLPEPPYVPSFCCNACGRDCNGFVYRCDRCNFDLDVHCSLISDKFIHEGHDHRLVLSCSSYSGKCSSCDSQGQSFRCRHCKFNLDFKCATLPPTIRYDPFEVTYVLCFEFEDDYREEFEYYCDMCGELRFRNHWFYYCFDGGFAAHPDCILGKYPYIKFEKTYTFDMHEHPLTFVDKSKGPHPLCDKCGDSCHDRTFECAKCNFSLHHRCLITNVPI
ncbi:uncharacterized protein LOC132172501 [Corylus avellana]|uniref:uncharacterized protein LOC132172501 n=1 Tax=Corylus avellana TaxID=13451 RepID=UPI001E1F1EA5|nr:uncharacterized protein LOC132172501 [Corylus avellana]